jgi:hypothetical protein
VVKKLIRLYPARWRQRYGEEMTRLLDDLAPSSRAVRLAIAVDMLLGAVDARMSRDFGGRTDAAPAIGLAAAAAVIGWLSAGAVIYLSNVVFPANNDAIPAVTGLFYHMAAFGAIGALASRSCAKRWSWLVASAVSGFVWAALTNATFTWVDNTYLGIVSKQQELTEEFRSSGMTSMRAFIDLSLQHQVVGITIEFTVLGLLFGTMGAFALSRSSRGLRDAPGH